MKDALHNETAVSCPNRRQIGAAYEEKAARFLEERGYRILARNFRTRFAEIDLVAEADGYLVFIEVKYRSGRGSGLSTEAVTAEKQRRIRSAALAYLALQRIPDGTPVRFDVVGFDGGRASLIRDAFAF